MNHRANKPTSLRPEDSTLLSGYYQPYVDQAWSKYTNTDLKIDTQGQWGVVTGRVSSSNGLLTFPNVGTFAKPSAIDIFSCSSGPFGNYPAATSDEMGAIGARCKWVFGFIALPPFPSPFPLSSLLLLLVVMMTILPKREHKRVYSRLQPKSP